MSIDQVAAPSPVDRMSDQFGGHDDHENYGQFLGKKFGQLWNGILVENPDPQPRTYGKWQEVARDRYLAMCCRLQELCRETLDRAGDADYIRDQFAEALVDRVEITQHCWDETHRGPYVPGGSYTERLCERVLAENEIDIDLADLDDVTSIPLTITAPYHGQGFDLTLQFDFKMSSVPGAGSRILVYTVAII